MKSLLLIGTLSLFLVSCAPSQGTQNYYPSAIQHQKTISYDWTNHVRNEEFFDVSRSEGESQHASIFEKKYIRYVDLDVNKNAGLVYERIPWTSLLSFGFVKNNRDSGRYGHYLMLLTSFKEKDNGGYLGVNAFGVTKNVQVVDGNYKGILIVPDDKDSYSLLYDKLIMHNESENVVKDYCLQSAQRNGFRWDKNVRIVAKLLMYTDTSGVGDGKTTIFKTPTLDDPVRSTNNYSFVLAKIFSVMYIDKKTNKILISLERNEF